MAILGFFVLVVALPFFIFAFLNFENLPPNFLLVPIGVTLGGIGLALAGLVKAGSLSIAYYLRETEVYDRQSTRNVEDRLDELERLKRRDMVTPEEYATKRQEILKDL